MAREQIDLTTLPNGVRVVSEHVPHVESVSIGIWVGVGERDETTPVRGISHFLEHMFFKGTERRDAHQIAMEIESRGGNLNAFTDKEYTCFYARALAEHSGVVMDVLSDMLLNSRFDSTELAREKGVVIEEIRRYKDNPEELVHDLFAATLWPKHPLGRPVIGTEETVGTLQREDLAHYVQTHYTADRLVVACSGNIAHKQIVELAAKHLANVPTGGYHRVARAPKESGKSKKVRKRTEQVHFCLGAPGYRQKDTERYTLSVLDTVLGGNMSSRLFQEVREKRGLAYSIGTYSMSYAEGGVFVVYGGTSPDTFDEVESVVRTELERVRVENVPDDELERAKMQMRGSLVLGLEGMSNRMMRMGRSVLQFGKVVPLKEIEARIVSVSRDDVDRVAQHVFNPERLTLAAIGSFAKLARASEATGESVAAG